MTRAFAVDSVAVRVAKNAALDRGKLDAAQAIATFFQVVATFSFIMHI